MNIKNFSVVTVVAVILVITTTVIVGTFSFIDFLSLKNEKQNKLRTELAIELEQLSEGLTLPVWNFDLPQIMKIIGSQMHERNISDIVVNASGKIYAMGRDAKWNAITTNGTISASDLISMERVLTARDINIGSVSIYMSPRFLEKELQNTMWNRAATILLLDLFLVLSLYLLLWWIILNPLRKINQFALGVNFENRNNQTLQNYHFYGELENMRQSIYRMFCLLDSHYMELHQTNERLNTEIIERNLTEKEYQKLSRAVEHGPASVVITNREGEIEYVNKKFCDLTGYSKEEVKGKKTSILSSGYHDKTFYKELWDTILSGNNWSGEMLNKKKNGDLFWEAALISPLINMNGDIINFVAIKDDISEKRNMISALIEAKEKAESASKLKDAFIANISHEIRTPLTGLLGMANLIRDIFPREMNKEDEELFEGLDFSSKRIVRTVDMILNYSRLQVGEFPILRKNLVLSTICINLVREYSTSAKFKSLEIKFQNNCGNANVFADEFSITLAISNIIDNAIKFTDKGSIDLFLFKDNNDDIILKIKDSGIGIGREYLDKIFEPYHQEQMGYGRAYDGVGLGLAMVKKVLELNGFNVFVESKKDKGTTFTINFSKEVLPEEKIVGNNLIDYIPNVKNIPVAGVVLLVEDDKINQTTIKRFIENRYTCIVTDSSNDAIEILNNKKVSLILMDISIMGNKNGLELTRELKASKEFSHIPVIAITAHTFKADKQNAIEAGCDGFLAKPFSRESLLKMIDMLLDNMKKDEL